MKIDGGECDEPNLYVDHCRYRRTNDARDVDKMVPEVRPQAGRAEGEGDGDRALREVRRKRPAQAEVSAAPARP